MVDDKSAIGIPVTLATFALVTGDTVDANLPIGAYHVDTIVHVHVASFPFETTWTLADKFTPRSRYQRAVPVVVARICRASIVLPLAIFVHEVFRAVTYVSVDSIDASAAILTGLRQTLVHVDLAIFTWRSQYVINDLRFEWIIDEESLQKNIRWKVVIIVCRE